MKGKVTIWQRETQTMLIRLSDIGVFYTRFLTLAKNLSDLHHVYHKGSLKIPHNIKKLKI